MAQIKISDELYKKLKESADSAYRPIGKQIEYLMGLDKEGKTTLTSPEVAQETDEGWVESNPPRKAEKLPCCLGSKPCKHWLWDMNTGDGYVNALTGEVREV